MAVNSVAIAILLGTFFVMVVFGVPITFALIVSSLATVAYLQLPIMIVFQQMAKGVQSFSLICIPFFILAGEIMSRGGISRKIINFANIPVGRFNGGLAYVNVLASMFFGGISGSAIADISSIGSILIPSMKDEGYDGDFSVAVTVTTACQGVVIPPSQIMIVYSLAAGGLSVAKLFTAGIIPGIMLGLSMMLAIFFMGLKHPFPKGKKVSFREALKIIGNAFFALFTAVIIMGGIIFGICTATESAALACTYALLISFLVYRSIKWKDLLPILKSSSLAIVLSLIAAANAFSWVLAYLQIPRLSTNLILSISSNKYVVLLFINVLLLFLGCIMDMSPLVLILTPILLPIVNKFGMSPIHFGVMMIINLAVGLCTPPVGSALMVGCAIGKTSIEKTTKAMIPLYVAMIITLLVVTYWSDMVMFLPQLINPLK